MLYLLIIIKPIKITDNSEYEFSSKSGVSKVNSTSEPNLATAGEKGGRAGFPPGITVDELWLYRRKRPSANLWPNDNLHLREGSFKPLKTEYKRRFKNYYDFGSSDNLREEISPVRASRPESSLKIEGPLELQPLYNDEYIQHPVDKTPRPHLHTTSFSLIDSNESEMKENSSENERLLTEIKSKYIQYPPFERPPLAKRPTNLKLEGDLYTTTEQAEQFIQFFLENRPPLLKKPTTLKLEGDMNINTENRDKFVPFDLPPKPPLYKKMTNLHLEGDLATVTEKQDKFVRYDVQKRPPLTKKQTNLHMEGELNFLPEYRREFIEYKTERPKPALPVNNLKTDGFYDVTSDVSAAFQQQIHPQIPNLRGADHQYEDLALKARLNRTREGSLKPEGLMEIQTESRTQFVEKTPAKMEPTKVVNNLLLEGRIDMNPEYRNAYIDFNNDVPKARSRRVPQENNLKSEGKMEISPEYKCSYVDFPRRRPQIKRPEGSLLSEGELTHLTEKNEKYVPFSNVPRTESLKRDPELKLEGHIECQPEYRKAYIDYLIRERVERKSRPLDNLGHPAKRVLEEEAIAKTSLVLPPQLPPQPQPPSAKEPPPKSAKSKPLRSPRNRSLSQIEASVFGPKLTVPEDKKKSSSRSTSPELEIKITTRKSKSLPRSRNLSNSSDSEGQSRNRPRTFGNPVLVENLASRSTTPVLPKIDISAKNKWMRDSSVESSSAFVVLDKNVKSAYNQRHRGGSDKWTPYWNSNSSEY